ncbi:DUF4136 domain-containing protein [Teredinibacter turnerae]|uniref:DUF4136 domain-containing protein n=1 Tax=Teredinibacter turnerae TaxID=2426 RepID=UPI00036D8934|nr:DUF4136 domain-containing protein [Teredinibacter turnerae]
MKRLLVTAIAAFTLLLNACANRGISTDYQTDVAFDEYRSYALLPVDPSVYANPKVSEITIKRIGTVLKKQLSNRYSEVEPNSADFLVRYFLVLDERMKVESYNANFGIYRSGFAYGHAYSTPDLHNTYYQQGSIIVDILDTKSQEVVWRGSTEGKVKEGLSPEQREARVAAQLSDLLEHFPPKAN